MTKGAAAAAVEIQDEYSLQPGELTKEMVAAKAGVSLRAVEKWKAEGKVSAAKKRRRVGDDPNPRPVLIFDEDAVEGFLKERDEPTQFPVIDRASTSTALAAREDQPATEMMMAVTGAALQALQNGGPQQKPSPFLSLDDAVTEYGLSPIEFHRLIDADLLRKFAGRNGKLMLSRRQIEAL